MASLFFLIFISSLRISYKLFWSHLFLPELLPAPPLLCPSNGMSFFFLISWVQFVLHIYIYISFPHLLPYSWHLDQLSLCVNQPSTSNRSFGGYLFGWFWFWFWFLRQVSLCSPETHSVDQAGLELRNLPASASQVLGLKACATTPSFNYWSINPNLGNYWSINPNLGNYWSINPNLATCSIPRCLHIITDLVLWDSDVFSHGIFSDPLLLLVIWNFLSHSSPWLGDVLPCFLSAQPLGNLHLLTGQRTNGKILFIELETREFFFKI